MSYSFQKEAIINILHDSEDHQSVNELHKKLTEIIPKVSLMTVYRNLNKLVKEGVAFPFHINNVLHYCGNSKNHYHLHCVSCNKTEDVYTMNIYNYFKNHLDSESFLPLSNGIIVKGFCNNCRGEK